MNVVHNALYARRYAEFAQAAGINYTVYYPDYHQMRPADVASTRLVGARGMTFNYRSSHGARVRQPPQLPRTASPCVRTQQCSQDAYAPAVCVRDAQHTLCSSTAAIHSAGARARVRWSCLGAFAEPRGPFAWYVCRLARTGGRLADGSGLAAGADPLLLLRAGCGRLQLAAARAAVAAVRAAHADMRGADPQRLLGRSGRVRLVRASACCRPYGARLPARRAGRLRTLRRVLPERGRVPPRRGQAPFHGGCVGCEASGAGNGRMRWLMADYRLALSGALGCGALRLIHAMDIRSPRGSTIQIKPLEVVSSLKTGPFFWQVSP
jgi:hypothetical protein